MTIRFSYFKVLKFLLVSLFFLSSKIQALSYTARVGEPSFESPKNIRSFFNKSDRDIKTDCIIKVNDQYSFDKIQESLEEALKAGYKNIEVVFIRGKYTFHNEHIKIVNFSDNVSIRFKGRGCILIPDGRLKNYKGKKEVLNYCFFHSDNEFNEVNVWTPFYPTDSLIQVVNVQEKICRLHVPSVYLKDLEISDNSMIQYTEWYYSRICKVERIDKDYIYFKVPELFSIGEYYNVNYDYRWHKVMPRFRVSQVRYEKEVYEGTAGIFCCFKESSFNSVSFEGLTVIGNCSQNDLFCLDNCKFEDYFLLFNCSFSSQRGSVISVKRSNNIYIQNCQFRNQYSTVIYSDRNTKHTEVTRNSFDNCGLGMQNDFCVVCSGSDYLVSRNRIKDFGYGAIAAGIWYKFDQTIPSNGYIECNEIFCSKSYLNNVEQHGLIDGGAIYLWTKNDDVVIRYNYIGNISGAGSNRGIYCDDGAYGFTIYGNVISNVINSNYIDSRIDQSDFLTTNTNNIVMYNIIEGRYKFEGSLKPNNGCIKGKNIVLKQKGAAPFHIVVNNIESQQEDTYLEYKSNRDLGIIVPQSTRKELRKLPFYRLIRKYLK